MDKKGFVITNEESAKEHGFAIPLYTHPVNPYQSITNTKIEPTVVSYTHPVKELTDEEIEEFEHLIAKAFDFSTQIKVVGLDRIIRAILRKAQNG